MPSSSLFLSVGALLSALSSPVAATVYSLGDSYAGSTFLNGFNFFTEPDPTHGFVKYLDKTTATNAKIVKMVGTDNYLGVDWNTTLNVAAGVGRGSVRIESKNSYNKGLFIVDVKHMPGGICGTWPAFWSLGSGEWPKNGEIDIIEGVNQNTQNKFVLHTDTNCKTNGLGQSGAQSLYDCALDSASGTSGCDVNAVQANTFGAGFNTKVGGAYVMEWTSTSIKMWFFPRGSIPASITADKPDTSTFGTPISNFEGACNMDTRFKDHRFIFNTAFCGDWAGNVYDQSSCPKYSGLSGMDSCKKYVAENPAAFKDAFWQITYFKTYKQVTAAVSSSTTARSTLLTTTRTSTSAAPTSTKKVTTDATCGGTNGFTCQGSTFGNCCSASGWCGATDAYCGTGCQSAFGTCTGVTPATTRTSSAATPTATKKVSTDATCGGAGGFTCQGSTFGNCCSAAGWCGATAAYCGTGCQPGFGTCTA